METPRATAPAARCLRVCTMVEVNSLERDLNVDIMDGSGMVLIGASLEGTGPQSTQESIKRQSHAKRDEGILMVSWPRL
jgi:hypothetical protein